MPKYTLDPTILFNDSAVIENRDTLRDMLLCIIEQSSSPFIPCGEFEIGYDYQISTIELTHNLLIRPRKHHTEQTRIEVLDRVKLAKGGYSSIYTSHGVLKPETNYRFHEKSIKKSRICKVIPIKKQSDPEKVECEAMYTAMNPMLHSKAAVFSDSHGYIVMRRAQKDDLFDLVDKNISLSAEQRFQITASIMEAIYEQAFKLGIIHNDIKPENLIIDWEQNQTTLIDYYFAQPLIIDASTITNVPTNTISGTAGFIAPEVFLTTKRTIQSDLFALGLTIAFFWGDNSSFEHSTEEMIEHALYYYNNRTWTGLFKNIDLPEEIKNKITDFLDLMTQINPKDRMSTLDDAITHWASIHADYKLLQKKREESENQEEGTLRQALKEFGIFKSKPENHHNSPQPNHKARSDQPLKNINNPFNTM